MKKYFIIFLIFLSSCQIFRKKNRGGSGGIEEEPTNTNHFNHVVMVIDSGIDPQHKAYRDKVIASYTLVCKKNNSNQTNEDKLSSNSKEKIKEKILEDIDNNVKQGTEIDDSCSLENGIKITVDPPSATALAYRDTWNEAIKSKDINNVKAMPMVALQIILSYLESSLSHFHGTNTTAVIAYKNPNIKLILVEKKLAQGNEAPTIQCAALEKASSYLESYEDQKIKDALIQKCTHSESELIDSLAKKHKVTLVNKSYGRSVGNIRKLLRSASCRSSLEKPLMTYIAAENEIADGIAQKKGYGYDQVPYLTIQAAGNEGIPIGMTRMDNPFCSGAQQHILVGSYDINGGVSDFSNFGACVGLYAPGSKIITSNPQDFLTITDGTSFAAPLTVRYLSFEFSEETPMKTLVTELKNRLDGQGFLPKSKHFQYAAWAATKGDLKLAKEMHDLIINDSGPLDTQLPSLPQWLK